jgi:hypothetical protein
MQENYVMIYYNKTKVHAAEALQASLRENVFYIS